MWRTQSLLMAWPRYIFGLSLPKFLFYKFNLSIFLVRRPAVPLAGYGSECQVQGRFLRGQSEEARQEHSMQGSAFFIIFPDFVYLIYRKRRFWTQCALSWLLSCIEGFPIVFSERMRFFLLAYVTLAKVSGFTNYSLGQIQIPFYCFRTSEI